MKTLILDNYDSFTYNVFQYVAELEGRPVVKKNDEADLKYIERLKPTGIIISPGPGTPENPKDFGVCGMVIKKYIGQIPILGICLGHQGIVSVLGGKIIKASYPMHGKTSWIKLLQPPAKYIPGCTAPNIFRNLPKRFKAMRYHSLIVDPKTLPPELIVTAQSTDDKAIMAIQHKTQPLWGIQFHPESIGTKQGKAILRNFLQQAPRRTSGD